MNPRRLPKDRADRLYQRLCEKYKELGLTKKQAESAARIFAYYPEECKYS